MPYTCAMRKKCILHLLKGFKRNSPLFINFIEGTDSNKFTHIICYLGKDCGLDNSLSNLGHEVIYLGFKKKSTEYFNPFVILKLARVIKERNIDILHCQKHRPTVYGTIASLISGGIPVISHVHGLSRTRSRVRRFTNWIILRHVKKIIAVSDSVREDIISTNWRIDPSKIVTVMNGIDLELIDTVSIGKKEVCPRFGIPEDEIVFGTVGRLAETKGQSYLIDAFCRVRKKIPHSRLVIIGDGPLSGELKKKADNLGLSSSISFTGYRNDVFELLRGFDIFVLPSLAEGLSIALLEAMASRLPVIASNVGGIPEVFGTAHCGKLVPPRDVSALESAMLDIYFLDEDQKKMLGENARKRVEEEFKVDAMSKKLSEVYESVLN